MVLRADNAILSVADLASLQDTVDTLTQAEWSAVPQVILAASLAELAGRLGCGAQLLQTLYRNAHPALSLSVQVRVTVQQVSALLEVLNIAQIQPNAA